MNQPARREVQLEMAKIQPPKGTRDFYPDEMRRHRHLENIWRKVSLAAGFEEVDGPIFESLELYIQKSGDEIAGQLYSFPDKGGRQIALRPEFTPTLARMVTARQAALQKPVKWFNISRVCRYERAQKGRLREFFQWNCDILGAPGAAADAECISVATQALREFGLSPQQVEVRLSSRRLLAALLKAAGLDEAMIPRVYAVLDKRGKVPAEVVTTMLDELELESRQRQAVEEIFAIENPMKPAAKFSDDTAVAEAQGELRELMRLLESYGAAEYVRFDIGIVRGLAYYTGPVWEVFDKGGTLRSLFGGGRYDNLIAATGGQPMAACGFGAGDVTMGLMLDQLNLWPAASPAVDCYVVYAHPEAIPAAAEVVGQLRQGGRSAQFVLNPTSMGKQMKLAADSGARFALIVGLEEVAAGKIRLRQLSSGEQRDIALSELPA